MRFSGPRAALLTSAICAIGFLGGAADAELVINEILADPDASLGDANGDDTVSTSEDEFLEVVNTGTSYFDLTGAFISDLVSARHVFPEGSVLSPGQAILIFGGGAPKGSFGGSIVQTATSGRLSLNNGGDTVTIADDLGVLATAVYGSEGGDNQSLVRAPELDPSGAFTQHGTAEGSEGALYSPGTRVDGSAFPAPEPAPAALLFTALLTISGLRRARTG